MLMAVSFLLQMPIKQESRQGGFKKVRMGATLVQSKISAFFMCVANGWSFNCTVVATNLTFLTIFSKAPLPMANL